MQIRSVGIDLGKTTFQLAALSAAGKVLLRKNYDAKFGAPVGRIVSELPTIQELCNWRATVHYRSNQLLNPCSPWSMIDSMAG